MIQAGSYACIRLLVRLVALHAVGNGRPGILRRLQNRREGKRQQKRGDCIRSLQRWHADWIALGDARLDGRRLMDGLLRRIVLRQSPMDDPAEHGQQYDKQTHTELATERALSGMHPGTP